MSMVGLVVLEDGRGNGLMNPLWLMYSFATTFRRAFHIELMDQDKTTKDQEKMLWLGHQV